MTTTRPELSVSGAPETTLNEATVARLPSNVAPAPWTTRCTAVMWSSRANDVAIETLPPTLRKNAKALAVIAGMVRYESTPVGAYDEVFGLVVTRQGFRPVSTVTFMAVDGDETLVGGRVNWAMPKAPATFAGDPLTTIAASGIDTKWRVQATARPLGPPLPGWAKTTVLQEFPDGVARLSVLAGRFRARPALVTVEVESEASLPDWLRPGRHPGAMFPSVTGSLGAPIGRRG